MFSMMLLMSNWCTFCSRTSSSTSPTGSSISSSILSGWSSSLCLFMPPSAFLSFGSFLFCLRRKAGGLMKMDLSPLQMSTFSGWSTEKGYTFLLCIRKYYILKRLKTFINFSSILDHFQAIKKMCKKSKISFYLSLNEGQIIIEGQNIHSYVIRMMKVKKIFNVFWLNALWILSTHTWKKRIKNLKRKFRASSSEHYIYMTSFL